MSKDISITYEVRRTATLQPEQIDPATRAYVAAWVRLEIDALSIQAVAGGTMTMERAREMARGHLSERDRVLLAKRAEPIEQLALPASEQEL